jgi:hypothetical protein
VRRSGIAFETVPPPAADTLPRMDIAAFAGFAEAGPIDVPVAVEDVARFRDLFGGDPAAAFDRSRGRSERGYLGAAVEAFFDGGGRRCWVVRLAERPHTCKFDLPGLIAPAATAAHPTRALARSPGSWARVFKVSTTLTPRPLAPLRLAGLDNPRLEFNDSGRVIRIVADVAGAPGTLARGDLLELGFRPFDLMLFLVVDRVELLDRGLRATATTWQWAQARSLSPEPDPASRSAALELLDDDAALDPLSGWRGVLDGASPQLRRLTFEISVWRDERLYRRIEELAFWHEHPRSFGHLPSDEDLFWRRPEPRPDGRDAELLALRAQASGERGAAAYSGLRFPLAGPQPPRPERGESWSLYLPDAMALTRSASDAVGPVPDFPPTLQQQDGLVAITPTLFFDVRLRDYTGDSLLRTAESLHNAAREWDLRRRGSEIERLHGLHALLPIEEATLFAVPDGVHRRWSTTAGVIDTLLPAPWLSALGQPDAAGRLHVAWTEVAGATSYEVEWDESPEFPSPLPAFSGSENHARVFLPPSCAPQRFFRVRALRHAEPSPWSNTRVLEARPGEFLPCAREALPELVLEGADGSPPEEGVMLTWHPEPAGFVLPAELTYRVESANDALFGSARKEIQTSAAHLVLPPVLDSVLYCRVRAELGEVAGPWSNTVVLLPAALSQPSLEPVWDDADEARLLEVHRALVRFCHARGDLLGLLSLPRELGAPRVLDYLAALTPDESAELTRDRLDLPNRPLTLGEAPALSYCALYHPWIARQVQRDGVRETEFVPPEGAAAGLLARVARERGAWISCANRPLPGVLALDPPLDDEQIAQLTDLQVNIVQREPRGFVLGEDQTLGRDRETRPIPVRRLLILLKRLALREGAAYVFEPMASDFPGRVRHRFQRLLSNMHRRGAFQGEDADEAYRVAVDASLNPPRSMELGRFVVELRVAPSRPLAFLRVRLVQSGPQELAVAEL